MPQLQYCVTAAYNLPAMRRVGSPDLPGVVAAAAVIVLVVAVWLLLLLLLFAGTSYCLDRALYM